MNSRAQWFWCQTEKPLNSRVQWSAGPNTDSTSLSLNSRVQCSQHVIPVIFILRPWRQGWRIDFQLVLQDLGILRPWRQGWRIDLPSFFGRTWESSDPAARVRRLVLHLFFCRTWESSLKTQTHTHTRSSLRKQIENQPPSSFFLPVLFLFLL